MNKTVYAATWAEAADLVRELAAGLPVLWGVGNPVHKPHVQVTSTHRAYHVTVKPQGDGYLLPHVDYTVYVGANEEERNSQP